METALEKVLTQSYKEGMIAYIQENPEAFEELVQLAVSNKQPYAWRAAWLLWSCMKPNDSRIQKHLKKMIAFLPECRDNQQRELLKVLEQMRLSANMQGRLFDICVNIWESVHKRPSIRFSAFKTLIQTAGNYPELVQEIALFTQSHYLETLSPGIKRSVERMIHGMKSLPDF